MNRDKIWTIAEVATIIGLFLCLFAASGCSNVRVAVPARPAMPLESVEESVAIDMFVAACIAEVARREAYEIELRSALSICNKDNK